MKQVLCLVLLLIAVSTLTQGQTERKKPDATVDAQATKKQAEAVKQELREASRAYERKAFAEAQRHAEKALELDPANKSALAFIARALYMQYRSVAQSPESIAKAREAIAIYQRISIEDSDDEEAFIGVRNLYESIGEDASASSWVMQRALDPGVAPLKRVEAYLHQARKELDCSSDVMFANHYQFRDGDNLRTRFTMPKDRKDFDKARECTARGMQLAESAIALQPESPEAWFVKAYLLLEMGQLAEMEEKETEADRYYDQAGDAFKESDRLGKKRDEEALARAVSVECGDLCIRVIETPVPPYPAIARAARAEGTVVIQITVNELGQVASASSVSGHPLLRAACVQAAQSARFYPKTLAGQPVKFSGVLTYHFTLPPHPKINH